MQPDTQPAAPKKIVVNDFATGQPTSPMATSTPIEPVVEAPAPVHEPVPVAAPPQALVEPSQPPAGPYQPPPPMQSNVPKFGELQPKVDSHPLFSGAKEPVPKKPRRWLKRTITPVIALLVAAVLLYLAVDAGLVKGYSHLPLHFFKAPISTAVPTITPPKKANTTTTSPYAGWKTYTLTYEKLTLKYPSEWTLKNNPIAKNSDGITLTTPDGFMAVIQDGGLGHPSSDFAANVVQADPITFINKSGFLDFLASAPKGSQIENVSLSMTSTNGLDTFPSKTVGQNSGSASGNFNIWLGYSNGLKDLSYYQQSQAYKEFKLLISSMSY